MGATATQEGTRRRRARIASAAVPLAALAAFFAAAAVTVLAARADLVAGRDAAFEARAAIADGDAEHAARRLSASVEAFGQAQRRLSLPHIGILAALPFAGNTIDTARAVAAAGALVGEAGTVLGEAVARLPGGVGAFAPRAGAIPLQPLASLVQPVNDARALLHAADATLSRAPSSWLHPSVARAHQQVAVAVDDLLDTTHVAEQLVTHVPTLLGAREPRRYFFGAQNPAELRGTGGLIGAFTILTIDQGRLEFGEFEEIQNLPDLPPTAVPAPNADYAARYDRYGGAGLWRNTNMTADFPSAARALEQLYAAVHGERIDGTILVDPFAFEALLRVAGRAEIPGVGTVDADDIVEVVANEAYETIPDREQRKRVLGAVAAGVLQHFLSAERTSEVSAVMRALGQAAAGRHLLIHAADAEVQAALDAVGVSGRLPAPQGDVLAVVGNNSAGNKADFFAERAVRYDVDLRPDGGAESRVRVTLRNEAPVAGEPAYVVGNELLEELAPGENQTMLSVYTPAPVRLKDYRRLKGDQRLRLESELGHSVLTTTVRLRSGESEEMGLAWTAPGRWAASDARGTYALTLVDQPTIRKTDWKVTVTPPAGMAITSVSDGLRVQDGRAVLDRPVTGATTVHVTFARAAAPSTWQRITALLRRPLFRIGARDAPPAP